MDLKTVMEKKINSLVNDFDNLSFKKISVDVKMGPNWEPEGMLLSEVHIERLIQLEDIIIKFVYDVEDILQKISMTLCDLEQITFIFKANEYPVLNELVEKIKSKFNSRFTN